MRLAAVVFKDDAGGALELIDDDAFRAVHDERALFGHQRKRAEINILLLAVAVGAGVGCFVDVINIETYLDTHGSFVGQALGNALGLVVLWLAYVITQIFQAGGAIKIFDGEHGTEDAFQPHMGIAFRFLAPFLQEGAVRVHLKIQKVRNGNGHFDFAELLRKLTHYFTSRMAVVRPCAGNVT